MLVYSTQGTSPGANRHPGPRHHTVGVIDQLTLLTTERATHLNPGPVHAGGTSGQVPSKTTTIRVMLVDDHAMVAEALWALLAAEPDLSVVGHATTLHDAFALVAALEPDLIVMDYRLPDGDGLTATEWVKARFPAVHVVMLTGSAPESVRARALSAGCEAVVSKEGSLKELMRAIRVAVTGESPVVSDWLAELLPPPAPPTPPYGLSKRELEVLRLLANGTSTDAIVGRLVLSPHTVRNHVRNILAKLNAHSKLEAVAIAVREGIVSVGEIRI